jgi:hypothetical protein
LEHLGKAVILIGVILVIVGVALTVWDRIPLLGKLPGDIHYRKGNFHLYVPLATSVLLSVVVTLIFWIVSHFSRR